MTAAQRDELLIEISNKVFNGFDQRMDMIEKEMHQVKRRLWGLLTLLFITFVAVVVDILIHVLPRVA